MKNVCTHTVLWGRALSEILCQSLVPRRNGPPGTHAIPLGTSPHASASALSVDGAGAGVAAVAFVAVAGALVARASVAGASVDGGGASFAAVAAGASTAAVPGGV